MVIGWRVYSTFYICLKEKIGRRGGKTRQDNGQWAYHQSSWLYCSAARMLRQWCLSNTKYKCLVWKCIQFWEILSLTYLILVLPMMSSIPNMCPAQISELYWGKIGIYSRGQRSEVLTLILQAKPNWYPQTYCIATLCMYIFSLLHLYDICISI